MPGETRDHERPLKLDDRANFFRSLLARPRLTGAIAPSGRPLARAMARALGRLSDGLVVELGPGTGPVTRALIERGLERRRLVLVEYDSRFCRMLESRFAPARIIEGDAYDLPLALASLAGSPISAFVSSLPLLNQPPHRRMKLIDDAFALMGPDGVFVQFTYGLLSPIPREACVGRYSAHRSPPVWRNLPPARVWTYRLDAHAGRGESPAAKLNRKAQRLGRVLANKRARAAEELERRGRILRDRVVRQAAGAMKELKRHRTQIRRDREDDP